MTEKRQKLDFVKLKMYFFSFIRGDLRVTVVIVTENTTKTTSPGIVFFVCDLPSRTGIKKIPIYTLLSLLPTYNSVLRTA